MKLGFELDDRRRYLRRRNRIARGQGLAGGRGRPALPAQGDVAVRAENAAHVGGLARLGFEGSAVEELDFHALAGSLGGDRGDAGGRTDKGNLVPRFRARNFRDKLQPESVTAGARGDELVLIAFPDHAEAGWKFRRHEGHVALEQRNRASAFAGRFRVDFHREFRLVVRQLADVMDFTQ